MAKKLVYNEDHMRDIADKYKKCATNVNTMITSLRFAKDIVTNNYEGQGEGIATDTFDKLLEHLEYLKVCCENTEEYVLFSLASMQAQDKNISQTIAR